MEQFLQQLASGLANGAIYACVALIYFVICYPLTFCARTLERKLARSR